MNLASPFQVGKTSGVIHSARITVQTHTLSDLAIPHLCLRPSVLFKQRVRRQAIWGSSGDRCTLTATFGCLRVHARPLYLEVGRTLAGRTSAGAALRRFIWKRRRRSWVLLIAPSRPVSASHTHKCNG